MQQQELLGYNHLALDVTNAEDKIQERYGRNSFGQRALLARRLVEAGVPFVTLYDGGWDHHQLMDRRQ